MSPFYRFVSEALADKKIDDADMLRLEEALFEDGQLDLDDVKLLVELYCAATERSAAFDNLFFNVLEQVFLADGEVQPAEQFYLLKMLYSDREVTQAERDFLKRLKEKASQRAPEFAALCEEAFKSPDRDWSTAGREVLR